MKTNNNNGSAQITLVFPVTLSTEYLPKDLVERLRNMPAEGTDEYYDLQDWLFDEAEDVLSNGIKPIITDVQVQGDFPASEALFSLID